MAWRLFVFLTFLQYGYTQTRIGGFMPGSSPATPNPALDVCIKQATPTNYNYARSGQHADNIQQWCSVYEEVIPCLRRSLPTATMATDWYLKLIYNETMATRMSQSMCARFPYISDLTCVDTDMAAVGKCMHWTTKSASDHFYSLFDSNTGFDADKQKMASIYACIISVATAGCFHKELKTCSAPKRKLMYDYYVFLSGQCREIAGIPDTTTTPTQEATDPDSRGSTMPTDRSRSSTRRPGITSGLGSSNRNNGSPAVASTSFVFILLLILSTCLSQTR